MSGGAIEVLRFKRRIALLSMATDFVIIAVLLAIGLDTVIVAVIGAGLLLYSGAFVLWLSRKIRQAEQ